MTRDEYAEKLKAMTALELGAEVAEKVMGWKWVAFHPAHVTDELVRRPYPPTAPEYNWQYSPCEMSIPLAQGWDWGMPRYSSDIAAAWEVAEKITDPYKMSLQMAELMANTRFGYWWDKANLWACTAAEAAREICIAACMAVWQDAACPACGWTGAHRTDCPTLGETVGTGEVKG